MHQHSYTIDELEQLVAATGQGRQRSKERAQSRNVPITSLPSFARDIRREILLAVRLSSGRMSRTQIAKALNLKKTTWLNSLIEELVCGGHLIKSTGAWRNGVLMYYYEVKR